MLQLTNIEKEMRNSTTIIHTHVGKTAFSITNLEIAYVRKLFKR